MALLVPDADADAGEDERQFFYASTDRASRAARSPPPSTAAQARAWQTIAQLADALEKERGLERIVRLPPTTWARSGGGLGGGGGVVGGGGGGGGAKRGSPKPGALALAAAPNNLDAGAPARPTAQLSHVFSLQRPIDANAREASFLTYQAVLPLEATQLAAAGMRSNSVRASVVHKPKKTCGGGQQTTRNNLGDMAAAWSSQATSVAIAMGAANRLCQTEHGIRPSNPAASSALDTAGLVAAQPSAPPDVFVVTSSTRLLPHALPTRLAQHSFLETMRTFACDEINFGTIRQRCPQQVDALRAVCNCIEDNTEGMNVWASWVLLVHMLSDPRLRKLVQTSPVGDMEAATAFLFQSYAHAEITRRARMDVTAAAQSASEEPSTALAASARAPGEEEEEEGVAVEYDDEPLADALALPASPAPAGAALMARDVARRKSSDKQTLSLKRKRPPSAGVVQPMGGGFLEYWQAALHSDYASILKMMITQSKQAAGAAAVDTLTGQAPDGALVRYNALLVDISNRNAIKSAEAISSLVVTTEARVPKILVWRCRDANNGVQLHVGAIRSPNDASNTTLHACRCAPKHCQPLDGTANHTVAVWSLAVRNTTPRDGQTSLLPGIMEAAAHLHALQSGRIQFHSRHQLTRVFDAIKQRAARGASDGSLDSTLTGVARGVIVLRAKLVVSTSQMLAGAAMAKDMAAARQAAARGAGFTPQSDFESCALLSEESLERNREPYATPASNLALGLQINEQLRVLMKNRSHRGDPCRHLCGVTTPAEMAEASVEQYDLPQALLPIVDCKVDLLDDAAEPLPNRRDACLRNAAITLTVCGDAPVRLPELLDTFCDRASDTLDGFFELMALTHAGAARASEVNDLATSVCAGHVNSSIASAKRILVGDLNLRPYLTLYQVWRVGTSNVPRTYETTPWSGCYGAGFDLGTSGGIGIRASSATADKRCAAFRNTHTHTHTHYPRSMMYSGGSCARSGSSSVACSGMDPRRPAPVAPPPSVACSPHAFAAMTHTQQQMLKSQSSQSPDM